MQVIVLTARADEGMWLPFLLKHLNQEAMIKKGLKIPVDRIYSETIPSLKDAVVIFGGGCTGEVISPNGLVLTNHHCGYGAVQTLSSVEKDYLTTGYWAMDQKDELPCSGLTVTFIIRIKEVTDSILAGIDISTSEADRAAIVSRKSDELVKHETAGTHYTGFVRAFFNGNQYYLFVTEVFKDIRLAGVPPSSIGNFGGDTDNWMWPRHTGDFSLFRIYADKDNKPAAYSPDNVPYRAREHFTISLKGIQEGDFTMVYGFPGRTQQYISSFAIDLIEKDLNPARIAIRDKRLEIMKDGMQISDTVRIKYASKQKGISNAYKKWKGELLGISRLHTADQKRMTEKEFNIWAASSGKPEYVNLVTSLQAAYENLRPLMIAADYYSEAAMGVELISYSMSWKKWIDLNENDPDALKTEKQNRKNSITDFYKNYDTRIDERMFARLLSIYYQNTPVDYIPDYLIQCIKKYKGDFNKFANEVFKKSIFSSSEKMNASLEIPFNKSRKQIESDPAFKLAVALSDVYTLKIKPGLSVATEILNRLNRQYMAAQMEMYPSKRFFPDANFTLRVAYGNISGYTPADAIEYEFKTTLEGVMQKEDQSSDEFTVDEKLKALYHSKDYGRYGVNQTMPVNFLATNHTTGGNSGSPVINAEGQLIGTNFDRVWEGTMSDLQFDPKVCRNISVDIRYTLFIIDKFANCQRIINELTIVQ